ncbi:MAG: DUF5686 family protein [Bacteroidetes bacterium]|nr:DUF5686 family protein [Bacteroidota bacterium]
MNRLYFLLLCLLYIPYDGFSQVTKIMGSVRDGLSGEVIPFANIIIPGTTTGTITDFNGNYSLEFKQKGDSIKAFLIGYSRITKKIQQNQFQTVDFALFPQNLNLPEVTIRYQGNPAEVLLEKVVRNKDKNSLQSCQTYQYEAYTKIELDANNISEKFRNRKILRKFDFVWNYLDTSTLNGKSYLPVFIAETMSDIYFRKSPRSRKEIITASSISGLDNASVSQFFGHLSEEVEIYKNFIPLFEKNFVSPIADFAIDYYKYYLVDSSFIAGKWCYHIMFKPRRKQELTFSGNLWINDTSFAVKKFQMRIAGDANVNFINDLEVEQEFEWTDHLFWMLTKDVLNADFNILDNSKKTLGFYGHRTSFYRKFQFDIPENNRFFRVSSDVFIDPDASAKSKATWDTIRPERLSATEQGIYNMVDSVKSIPVFRTYTDIIYGIFTGYLSWGMVELGPYSKFFSYNAIEGARFRFGMRTSNKFSKKIQLEGYLAYGTFDQTFKYGGDLIYMFSKNPRRDLTAGFKYDVEQLGLSATAFSTDNILSSLFHRGPNDKLTMVREYQVCYEHEWYTGFLNRLHFIHREVFPLGSTEFIVFPESRSDPRFMNSIYTSEIQIDTRLAFRERFLAAEFARVTISSVYPIIQLSFTYGIPQVFNSDYEYQKLTLNVSQWFHFATIGWSKYLIEAGKIWGTLPYPLLKIHDGNQTFFYDSYSSNLMNYYEFVSDTWITASFTHHFEGLLFNKIPLIRKLKWREVASAQVVYGTLTDKNAQYSLFPDNMRSLAYRPYWEAGVGIENIFKIIRIDAIWRMSHLQDGKNPNVPKFGIFASLFFSF